MRKRLFYFQRTSILTIEAHKLYLPNQKIIKMPRRIMLLLSFIILQNVDITHSSSYKNQVNYCSYNDKFVSNIIKDVTNGTLECKRDYTFIPLKQNIEIQYIWILTDENILTNLDQLSFVIQKYFFVLCVSLSTLSENK